MVRVPLMMLKEIESSRSPPTTHSLFKSAPPKSSNRRTTMAPTATIQAQTLSLDKVVKGHPTAVTMSCVYSRTEYGLIILESVEDRS
jgi:hypothetical protein